MLRRPRTLALEGQAVVQTSCQYGCKTAPGARPGYPGESWEYSRLYCPGHGEVLACPDCGQTEYLSLIAVPPDYAVYGGCPCGRAWKTALTIDQHTALMRELGQWPIPEEQPES